MRFSLPTTFIHNFLISLLSAAVFSAQADVLLGPFQPGTGKEITRYQPGSNTVVVHIERQTDPGVEIDIYEWTFTSKS